MPIKHLKNELIKVFKNELRVKVKEKSKHYGNEKKKDKRKEKGRGSPGRTKSREK